MLRYSSLFTLDMNGAALESLNIYPPGKLLQFLMLSVTLHLFERGQKNIVDVNGSGWDGGTNTYCGLIRLTECPL